MMKLCALSLSLMISIAACTQARASTHDMLPQPAAAASPLPTSKDIPFPGVIKLSVDATDTDHAVLAVHETLPVAGLTRLTLLYPEWVVGNHGPSGPIDKLAGLTLHAGGQELRWVRDPVDRYAFHVALPPHTPTVEVDFQLLSPPTSKDGRVVMTPDMLDLEWHQVVLYPAGHFARQIRIEPSLKLPSGFTAATSLTPVPAQADVLRYRATTLEELVDSPVLAGRYSRKVDLDLGAAQPVTLNIFADAPWELAASDMQLEAHRSLVRQAYRLLGPGHYEHYDFLLYLSDRVGGIGFEHAQSSENGSFPQYFTDWDRTFAGRDLLSHEFVHSWNGKFRRPNTLWVPSFEVPMRDDLLWVYEGLTQYWGYVLAARSGLITRQQALDTLAYIAAGFDNRPGRRWRSLQDTTNDPALLERKPQSWVSWQRFHDYYGEALLVWLDADTSIRERSGGNRSLDDFARAFYDIQQGRRGILTYTVEDLIRVLNSVQQYDWRAFFDQRLQRHGPQAPLEGVARAGYELIYDSNESPYMESLGKEKGILELTFSGGLNIDASGGIVDVLWDSAAFAAGLTTGSQLIAVNGQSYTAAVLKEALTRATQGSDPIELLIKTGTRYRTVRLDYHEGLRYPHLKSSGTAAVHLDDVLEAKP